MVTLTLVGGLAGCASGHSSLTGTGSTSGNVHGLVALLKNDRKAFAIDFAAISSAARIRDLPALSGACRKMTADASDASSHLAVTDVPASLRHDGQAGLSNLVAAGKVCEDAVSTGDPALLEEMMKLIDAATVDFGVAVSTPSDNSGATPTVPEIARIGDRVSLGADGNIPAVEVTLVGIVDPAHSTGGDATIIPGTRSLGVRLRLVFAERPSFPESADLDTKVYDSLGHVYSDETYTLRECQQFPLPLDPQPRLAMLGCVAFRLPASAIVSRVTFTPKAANADISAQWYVP